MKASSDDVKSPGGAAPAAGSSAWAPFRSPDFARMASAQFVSNIGGWMQTVGAQELMLTLTTSATMVALIQTAAGLPVVLLSVPAGAIGDLVDRRRLLIASQSFMLIAALLLAGLTFAGLVTPLVLLALIFAVGIGQTLTSPVWQTLQPELVAPEDRTQAISLGAVNMNLSRAIGPALGGALYAASSAALLFLVNALSFVPVIGAVARWRGRPRSASAVAREHVVEATRAGARYVAGSPALRVIMLRAGLFMFFGNALWALLPVVANTRLHLGSGGYGLLLGGVGIGAVAGAAALPRLRGRVTTGALMTSGTLVFAAVTLALAYARVTALAGLALVIGGVAWILVLSTLTSQYQSTLPGWAKARGMSYFLVIFQGGGAIGSAAFGAIAQSSGLTAALLAAAFGLALVAITGIWLPFKAISPQDLLPAGDWPAPHLVDATGTGGPVQVTVEYWPRPGLEPDLVEALRAGRYARRRTGAVSWRVWRDAANPGRVLEQFVVASWEEHLRQHERVSIRDQQRLDKIRAMTDPSQPTTVTHWLSPPLDRHAPTPPSFDPSA
jgi:predicted MFS family arabinose efflux permease